MSIRNLVGDCRAILSTLPDESVHCVVTSPPYFGLRDYGVAGQIGLEATPEAYVAEMVAVFREAKRVLRKDGTVWLNLGDSYAGSWGNQGRKEERGTQRPINGDMLQSVHDGRYPERSNWRPGNPDKNGGNSNRDGLGRVAGLKSKDLIGIPWSVAFALRADGWWLRQDVIWSKPNPMPESVTDRCTKAHEYIFMLTKAKRYYFDAAAIAEASIYDVPPERRSSGDYSSSSGRNDGGFVNSGTRNKRSVWHVATQPYSKAHFATFPPALIEPCILAGCPKGGTVLDPFGGAGTTGLVADRLQRNAILIELNPAYGAMASNRIRDDAPLFAEYDYDRANER